MDAVGDSDAVEKKESGRASSAEAEAAIWLQGWEIPSESEAAPALAAAAEEDCFLLFAALK